MDRLDHRRIGRDRPCRAVIDEEVFGHVVAPLLAPLIRPVIVKYSLILAAENGENNAILSSIIVKYSQ